MRLLKHLLLLGALSLAACASRGPASDQATAGDDAARHQRDTYVRDASPADCEAAGGSLTRLGRGPAVYCVTPFPDAGKACSRRSDCRVGACLAPETVEPGKPATGLCQRDASETFGCRQRIEKGVAEGMLCID